MKKFGSMIKTGPLWKKALKVQEVLEGLKKMQYESYLFSLRERTGYTTKQTQTFLVNGHRSTTSKMKG